MKALIKILVGGAAVLYGCATLNSAQAGFDWTPAPAAPAMPKIVAAPQPVVDAEPISPMPQAMQAMPLSSGDLSSQQMNSGPADFTQGGLGTVPLVPAPDFPDRPTAVPATSGGMIAYDPATRADLSHVPPVNDGPAFEMVEGFGRDIPLVMAMSQVIPEDYSYSFDPAVNPGVEISWNGGKPWDQVLQTAIAPHGLSVSVVGNTVWVRNGPPLKAPSMPAPQPMMNNAGFAGQPLYSPQGDMMMAASAPIPPMQPSPPPLSQPMPQTPSWDGGASGNYQAMMNETNYSPSYPRRTPPAGVVPQATLPAPVMPPPPQMQTQTAAPMMATPYMADMAHGMPPVPGRDVLMGGNNMTGNDAMMPMPLAGGAAGPLSGAGPQAPSSMARAPYNPFANENFNTAVTPKPVSMPAAPSPMAAMMKAPPFGGAAGNVAVLDPFEIKFWQAQPGESMRNVLSRWASEAGVQLVWNAGTDFTLSSPIGMHGTFSDAVTNSFMMLSGQMPRPTGQLYPNLPLGPSVLVVRSDPPMTN